MSNQCGAVVQLVRIPACHAGGRGFESRPLRHLFQTLAVMLGFFRFYSLSLLSILIDLHTALAMISALKPCTVMKFRSLVQFVYIKKAANGCFFVRGSLTI